MDPNVWGPHAWQFLHSITLAYPDNPTDNDKQSHSQFFDSLKNILPCDKCKYHYAQTLETNPIENHLEDKESLFRWLVDVHNRVNVENSKKEYSYDEVTEIYEKMYGKSDNGLFINNQWLYVIFVFLLLCLAFYYIRK